MTRKRVKVFSQRSMNKFNLRTVAKAMGGRTTGQRGVRGLSSEKKVRIGEQEESRYFTGFTGQKREKQYAIKAFQRIVNRYVIDAFQAAQVDFGETHPLRCPSCWKEAEFSIWSVGRLTLRKTGQFFKCVAQVADYLSEITMSLLAAAKNKNPQVHFAGFFSH